MSCDDNPGIFFGKSGEPLVGYFPVGAALEVLQCDVHRFTVNLKVHFKVKDYSWIMLIGEVADALGIHRHTIRFYEKQGLLPAPHRQPNGYRDYDPAIVSRVNFIQSGQAAGLTLSEITSVLSLRDAGQAPCTHVSTLLERKLEVVHERQLELAALEAELTRLIYTSKGLDPSVCSEADICNIIARTKIIQGEIK